MLKRTTEKPLPDGLVTLQQYQKLIASNWFKEIEVFSDDFIQRVGPMIQTYNIRWVPDPLHQWSRQWEYPYIISQAQEIEKDAVIVDLGAGISFLPYYLKRKIGVAGITTVDCDRKLKGLYEKVNNALNEDISFQFGDMRQLNAIVDGSVDFAYSVSVLEHTDAYPVILKEIYRILKPGGKLSFTFDISINGLDDIPLKKARELLMCVQETFTVHSGIDLDRDIQEGDVVTSYLMAKKDRKLMPWKYPLVNVVKPLIKHRKLGNRFKKLTFCCVTVLKDG